MFACVWWFPTHIVLCFLFVFLRLVYPMLPVSLDCPFLITPSVFSSVYLLLIQNISLLLSHIWTKTNTFLKMIPLSVQ